MKSTLTSHILTVALLNVLYYTMQIYVQVPWELYNKELIR